MTLLLVFSVIGEKNCDQQPESLKDVEMELVALNEQSVSFIAFVLM